MNNSKISSAIDNLEKNKVKNYYPIIITLLFGSALPLLDATIVGISIPSLGDFFGASVAKLQWVAMIYTLSAAVVIPLCTWSIRWLGSRSVWLIGLFVFMLGSLLCGLASSLNMLIFSRAIQGVGAGILMPAMQSVLLLSVGRKYFKTAMATIAIPAVMIPILGPIIASGILSITSWHWIFLINIPIAIISIFLAIYYLPKDIGTTFTKLDIKGFMLYSTGIILLIYGLSDLGHLDKFTQKDLLMPILSLITSFILCSGFIKYTQSKAIPLINISLFCIASFRSSCELLFLASLIFYAGLFILPLFFIDQFHYSIFTASLLLGASGIGTLASRSYIKTLCVKFGVSGTALFSIGALLAGTLPLFLNELSNFPWLVAICMLVRGAGVGLLTLLAMTHAYHDIPSNRVADASAWSRILTMIGASVGAASIVISQLFEFGNDYNKFTGVLLGMTIFGFLCIIPAKKL